MNQVDGDRKRWRHKFGKRLLELMEDGGICESELRRRTGISKSTLYYYVHAQKEPAGYSVYKLCRALGVSADVLLGTYDEEEERQ